MIRSVRWTLMYSFVGLAMAGCGPSTGSISGTVTYQGAPLPLGTVTFVPAKGDSQPATIQDGKFHVDNVPVGEAKVTVSVPMAVSSGGGPFSKGGGPPAGKGGVPKDAPVPQGFDPGKANKGSTIKIPNEYSDAKMTPLNYTVIAGKQQKDFDIK